MVVNMVKEQIWVSEPLEIALMTILSKKEAMRDIELYENLKQMYTDLSFREFNKALMKLEIWGKIIVTVTKKGIRNVSIIKRE